jgi:hypothetical protein
VKEPKPTKAKVGKVSKERSSSDILSMLSPEQAEKLLAQLDSIPPEEDEETDDEQ